QKGACVLHRAGVFDPVPYDPWVGRQLAHPSRRISRDLLWIELTECAAVALAFVEHDRPAESRLRGFENEELEVSAVVVGRHTPLPIVVVAHQRIVDVD